MNRKLALVNQNMEKKIIKWNQNWSSNKYEANKHMCVWIERKATKRDEEKNDIWIYCQIAGNLISVCKWYRLSKHTIKIITIKVYFSFFFEIDTWNWCDVFRCLAAANVLWKWYGISHLLKIINEQMKPEQF